eukprot:CAMPEP_0117819214 /NCGR_PEP_ID=MMETSP0949-20121206/1723_1 /TAXON_ID=44440 /ORGANISM="Chattonella subsalsa, Strain CCMP2191" /LENGTH=570 /DNA_ID=CAMNT_0005657903 /DNA_START=802 /DNA_END=2510 /DNA_ORIENTATION=-
MAWFALKMGTACQESAMKESVKKKYRHALWSMDLSAMGQEKVFAGTETNKLGRTFRSPGVLGPTFSASHTVCAMLTQIPLELRAAMTFDEKRNTLGAVALVFEKITAVFEKIGSDLSSDQIETYAAILSSSCSDTNMFDEDAASSALSVLESIITGGSITSTAAASIVSTISNLMSYSFSSRRRLLERALFTSSENQLITHMVATCEALVSSETEGYSSAISEDEVQITYAAYYGADLCTFIEQSQSDEQIDAGLAASGIKLCKGLEDDEIIEICSLSFSSSDVPSDTISTVYKVVTSVRDDSARRRLYSETTNNSDIVRIGFNDEYEWANETIFKVNGTCPGSDYYTENACGGGYNVSCTGEYSTYQLECISNSSYPVCLSYDNSSDTYATCSTVHYTSSEIYCNCGSSDGTFIAESRHVVGSVTVSFVASDCTTAPITQVPTSTAVPTVEEMITTLPTTEVPVTTIYDSTVPTAAATITAHANSYPTPTVASTLYSSSTAPVTLNPTSMLGTFLSPTLSVSSTSYPSSAVPSTSYSTSTASITSSPTSMVATSSYHTLAVSSTSYPSS